MTGNPRKFLSIALLSASLLLFVGCAPEARAQIEESTSTKIAPAIAAYKAGEYQKALLFIKGLDIETASAPLTHYYSALCLQQLKQNFAAYNEYNYVYMTTHNRELKYKAFQGLKSLKPPGYKPPKWPKPRVVKAKSSQDNVWIKPKAGYGKSGPAATASKQVTIIPTSCSRRH
ncbi:MAG: hypothetical protein AB7V06_17445 [Candidatus Obscuribacterales bacterium]